MSLFRLSASVSLLAIPLMIALVGCEQQQTSATWADAAAGPKVLTSFAPIHCFVTNITGDSATTKLVFADQGPHHLKDSPAHITMLHGADLFFINGLGLENSNVKRLVRAAGNKSLSIIGLGDRLPEGLLIEGGCECCKDDHKDGDGHDHHDHEHGDHDPHVWLGLDQAKAMVETIRNELQTRHPADAMKYSARATEYLAKLDQLKAEGQALLKGKTQKAFISFHGSLGYFAKSFGLPAPEVIQTNPGQEPTSKELDKIIKRCVEKNIRVIAIEPQYGASGSAKAIQNALEAKGVKDVQLIVVDPLETAVASELNAAWYETKMRANIEALAKALK